MAANIIWHDHKITKQERAKKTAQKPCVLWFTGLSGSGKSTIANALEEVLYNNGNFTYLLDGDNVRHGLNSDLGFDEKSRIENIRRVGEVAKLFVQSGLIVLTAFISPFRSDRELVKKLVEEYEFIEIFIDTPLEVCESRDPKGLYKKARAGEIKDFTGIDSPYEAPTIPSIHIKNNNLSIEKACQQIIEYLIEKGYISAKQ
jgi:adenylylsulfate kinase